MTRLTVVAVLLAVLLAAATAPFATALRAQAPAASEPSRPIHGRVVADDTGDPIANAKVSAGRGRIALTDASGNFALELPVGQGRIVAAKPGYARRETAVRGASNSIELRLARGGVITGRVVDAAGDPVPNANVRAGTAFGSGLSILAAASTDDRGDYRLAGLGTGRVIVMVQAMSATTVSQRAGAGVVTTPMVTTRYYPGVEAPTDAEPVVVEAGREQLIDFALPAGHVTPAGPGGIVSVGLPAVDAPVRREPTTSVRGRVVSATGGAVAGARVTLLNPMTRTSDATPTDREGRFAFADVIPGRFLVTASKVGYLVAPGLPATVSATGATVDLTLTPWGSVSGRVVDELGEPVEGAAVQLLQLQFQQGRRRLVGAEAPVRQTDDRGEFRIFGVPAGQYVVAASVGDVTTAELPGYARTFYPGVTEASATALITLGPGQSQPGVEIALVRQRTARVSGTIRDAQGRAGQAGSLTLVPSQSSSLVAAPVGARIDSSGVFEFPNVPPGTYVIQNYRGQRNRSTEGEFGSLVVTVGDRDLDGLVLQTRIGSTITGRVSFVRGAAGGEPARSAIDIEPVPVDPDLAPLNGRAKAEIGADWTFAMTGVSGPRRLEVTRLPPGWALKEIRARGVDVTDRPLEFGTPAQSIDDVEVELTDRLNQVAGRVTDRNGRPPAAATVVAFPPFRDRWYAHSRFMRSVPMRADGTFVLDGLPAGTYYLAAVASLPTGGSDAWEDPSFLESLIAPAATVSLGDADHAAVNLVVMDTR